MAVDTFSTLVNYLMICLIVCSHLALPYFYGVRLCVLLGQLFYCRDGDSLCLGIRLTNA